MATSFTTSSSRAIWTAIGFVVMLLAMQFDYQQLKNRRIVYGLLICHDLLLLAVFAFPPINGARRWIKFQRLFDSTVGTFKALAGDLPRLFP